MDVAQQKARPPQRPGFLVLSQRILSRAVSPAGGRAEDLHRVEAVEDGLGGDRSAHDLGDVELRQQLWKFIRELNVAGHTIVLTTHYLEEAESLCGRIAMLKQGRIVALDETANLLKGFSGVRMRVRLEPNGLPAALDRFHAGDEGALRVLQVQDYLQVEAVLAGLREAGVRIMELEILQADLEDVFVQVMRTEPR